MRERRRKKKYAGSDYAGNISRLFWASGSAGLLVPKAGRFQRMKEGVFMIILGGIVLLMGVYLVYALVHPEKF